MPGRRRKKAASKSQTKSKVATTSAAASGEPSSSSQRTKTAKTTTKRASTAAVAQQQWYAAVSSSYGGSPLVAEAFALTARILAALPDNEDINALITQREQLEKMLNGTVAGEENHGVLIVGPPGSGKSMLLERAISNVQSQHEGTGDEIVVVRLSGLYIKDDRTALREIWRQIHDRRRTDEDHKFKSFQESLKYIIDHISADNSSTAFVFVLDHFDQFAHQSKQILLYSLFDTMHRRDCHIAVVGLSTRMDAVELLEKRVKSRFSHRHIFTFADVELEPAFASISRRIERHRGQFLALAAADNHENKQLMNRFVDMTCGALRSKEVIKRYQQVHDLDNTFGTLINTLTVALSRADSPEFVTASDIGLACEQQFAALTLSILMDLTALEFFLLCAAVKLRMLEQAQINFETIYAEYERACLRLDRTVLFSRQMAMKAFEKLVALKLLRFRDQSKHLSKENRRVFACVENNQVFDALQRSSVLPTSIRTYMTTATMPV